MKPSRPAVFEIASAFLALGGQGFGGQGALLVLLIRELVERRAWLSEADITEAFTYTKLLPGSTVVQVVAFLGWKLRGASGVAAATIAFLLPAFSLMLAFAASYRLIAPLSGVAAALQGLTAAAVGLVVFAAWTLARKNIAEPAGVVVAVVVCVASVRFGISPALLVIAAGGLGIVREVVRKGK